MHQTTQFDFSLFFLNFQKNVQTTHQTTILLFFLKIKIFLFTASHDTAPNNSITYKKYLIK